MVEDDFGRDALPWHDQLGKKSKPSADNLLAALARVLSFAKENKLIKVNQLETFERLYKNDRSEMTWSDDLVGSFAAVARPSMVTAMYLVRNTGQRQKDIRGAHLERIRRVYDQPPAEQGEEADPGAVPDRAENLPGRVTAHRRAGPDHADRQAFTKRRRHKSRARLRGVGL